MLLVIPMTVITFCDVQIFITMEIDIVSTLGSVNCNLLGLFLRNGSDRSATNFGKNVGIVI